MRPRLLAVTLVALATLGPACSAPTRVEPASESDEIVSVPQTDLERRSIGASWLYAHARWVASMHEAATGERLEISEAYWAYFFFFDQITVGHASAIATGGNWATANRIVAKYGLVPEDAFAPASPVDASTRLANATHAIDESLATGALSSPSARKDRSIVRRELDRAWALSPAAVAMLDRAFGDRVTRSFASRSEPADTAGTPILRADAVEVAYTSSPGGAARTRRLSDAMSEWRQAYYAGADRRAFLVRVQRALHDRQPIVLTWFVDFDALETRTGSALRGAFALSTLKELGPGAQGGDTAIVEGYDAHLADGRTITADRAYDPKNADDRSLLDAALLPSTQVTSVRVKDAWGASRPPRPGAEGMAKHDLHLDYLDGPVARCVVRDGETDTKDCPYEQVPLQDVVLPPGY
jgi:hypothetical protein